MPPSLSVVFGTYNRFCYLLPCLASIRAAVGSLSYEIVIVDGGSTDGTLEHLRAQKDVKLLEHGSLRGCVRAYNDGFALAGGEYVCYLNDDLTVLPGTLQAACRLLTGDPQIGLVALRYTNPGEAPTCGRVKLNGARYPFASFGVLSRQIGAAAGWFNGYQHYYGDCHLSLTILDMGYRVEELTGPFGVAHYNADNAFRGEKRWQLPATPKEIKEHDGLLFHKHWDAWEGPHG